MPENHGFELIKEQYLNEYNANAKIFRHNQTGARLLSIENDDENKVFGISFRTPPKDSTGVAHILEHSVLCGSRKFPVKEPFIELVKGSLNTFLNAMTYPDKTCYPVASQNLKDFYNLIDVYLDAVLYPLATPLTFQQEGWHYELESPDVPLTFKGVVFNEMKGAYSSPDGLLEDHSLYSLFPDSPYGVSSGGDPEKIPDLTYEQFKDFHHRYYHPSNALIYFYGDDAMEERLRFVNEYLKDFQAIEVDSAIPIQPRLVKEKSYRITIPYDSSESEDENNKKAMMTVNWLLPEIDDPKRNLALSILSHILLGTPASPLRKALIDSGLGEDITGGGLENQLRQMVFSVGLKGISAENTDRVVSLIEEVLLRLAKEGIDPATVAASLNTIEFALRENNTGSYPRGLALMLRALTVWLHELDPLSVITFEAPLTEIKTRISSGERFFEKLIREHMLENNHRTTVLLVPDSELSQRREKAEQARLEKVRNSLDEKELHTLVENTLSLQRHQQKADTPEALATIPSLKLEDLERLIRHIPIEVSEARDGVKIISHDLSTNGIVYLDIGFDMHTIPQEWLPYMPLFGRCLFEMGTETQDFVQLSQRIGRYTGGIHPTRLLSSKEQDNQGLAWFFLRGKATLPNLKEVLAILNDVLLTVRLDNLERFRQLAMEAKAGMESRLSPAGHQIVNHRLRARYNSIDWASEQMGGINYLFFLRDLVDNLDSRWKDVLATLESIRTVLINRPYAICNLTIDSANQAIVRPALEDFLTSLPSNNGVRPTTWKPSVFALNEGLGMPSMVNYVAKGADLYQSGYQYNGSSAVILHYLKNTWLWDKVRVQGGAYGGFCAFDRHSGIFTYLSYRDPNLKKTLEIYDQSVQFLRNLSLDPAELTKSIIGVIGDIDSYQLPDAKGFTSLTRYLMSISDAERQRTRDEIFATTEKDFQQFGEVLAYVRDEGSVVVLGAPEALSTLNAESDLKLEITKVL